MAGTPLREQVMCADWIVSIMDKMDTARKAMTGVAEGFSI